MREFDSGQVDEALLKLHENSKEGINMYWGEVGGIIIDHILNPVEQTNPALTTFEQLEQVVERAQQRFNNASVDKPSVAPEEEDALVETINGIQGYQGRIPVTEPVRKDLINLYLTRLKEFYHEENEICEALSTRRGNDEEREAVFAKYNITGESDKDEYMRATQALILSHEGKDTELSALLEERKAAIEAQEKAQSEKRTGELRAARERSNNQPHEITEYALVRDRIITEAEANRYFSYQELNTYNHFLQINPDNTREIIRHARNLGILESLGRVNYELIPSLVGNSKDLVSWATDVTQQANEPDALYARRRAAQAEILSNIVSIYNARPEPEQLPEVNILKTLASKNAGELYPSAMQAYKELYIVPDDLNCSAEKARALLSPDALTLNRNRGVRAAVYKNCDVEQITILTSPEAQATYNTNRVSPTDLVNCSVEKIKLLISPGALAAYNTSMARPADLKDNTPEEIALLVSPEVLSFYKQGREGALVLFSDFKNCTADQIKALTTASAKKAYETYRVRPGDLKDNTPEEIALLTSPSVVKAYETREVKPEDFKGLDPEIISALTTDNAISTYKTKKVQIKNLKGFDVERIQILTTPEARERYGRMAPDERIDFKALESISADRLRKIFNLPPKSEVTQEAAVSVTPQQVIPSAAVAEIGTRLREAGAREVANAQPHTKEPTTRPGSPPNEHGRA